jgi:nucleoside-diphosphate-sugar epimerase
MRFKALVTGGGGFIGSHLVERLLDEGASVRVLVRRPRAVLDHLRERGAEVVTGDVRCYDHVARHMQGVQRVWHLAALTTDWAKRRDFWSVTVGGTDNVCRAALHNGVKRLVYLSTNDVFGPREDAVIDESFPYRRWNEPYPDSKIAGTERAWRWHRRGLPVTMAYPCWVVGPRDFTFTALLADAVRSGLNVTWRHGAHFWPAYVGNVVDLLVLLGQHPAAVGEGFLVHDGEAITLQAYGAAIAWALGCSERTFAVPYMAAWGAAWLLEQTFRLARVRRRPLLTTYAVRNLGSRLHFSIAKARRLLGWQPQTPCAEGVRLTMEWLRTVPAEQLASPP